MRSTRSLIALAILAALLRGPGPMAAAQTPPVQVPQANPVERMAPQAPVRLSPSLQGPAPVRQTGPAEARMVNVAAVTLVGNAALSGAALAPALEGLAGALVSLSRIEEARLAILRAYRDGGYPFVAVNAGLSPRPDGSAGLAFAVTEGHVDEILLEGDRAEIGPAGSQILRFLQPLVGKRPLAARDIERALLLASDIPGMRVSGTLRPLPTQPGALQLIVQVQRRRFEGYANIDNRGSDIVGPWQGLFVVGANAFSSFGERSEIAVVGAPAGAQRFVQGSSEMFLGGSGLRLRAHVGAGRTRPTDALRRIGYVGDTQLGGIGLTYPVIRSRPLNLTFGTTLDLYNSEVTTGTTAPVRASLDKVRTWRAGFDLQVLDGLIPPLPMATSVLNLRGHHGLDILGATPSGDRQSGRSGAESFDFWKLTAEAQRTQPLWSPGEGQMIGIQGVIAGQWTDDILPQSEKFFFGGNRIGRGFYSGQMTGDRAFGFAIELQYDIESEMPLPVPFGGGGLRAQFYLFRDLARSFENLETDSNRRLSAWGGGVRTIVSDALQLDLEAAHRVTRRPEGAAADALSDSVVFFRSLVRF